MTRGACAGRRPPRPARPRLRPRAAGCALLACAALWWAVLDARGCAWVGQGQSHPRHRRRHGAGSTELAAFNAKTADLSTIMAEAQRRAKAAAAGVETVAKPKFNLPGPLKPPPAPATYKALTKLFLRTAPSRFAEIAHSTNVIEEGTIFRVIKAVTDEDDPSLVYLRVDREYEEGWILDQGIAGKWAGKKTIKRVAGSMKGAKIAIHQLSAVETAEVVGDEKAAANKDLPVPAEQEVQKVKEDSVQSVLEDPRLATILAKAAKKAGVDPKTLQQIDRSSVVKEVSQRIFDEK